MVILLIIKKQLYFFLLAFFSFVACFPATIFSARYPAVPAIAEPAIVAPRDIPHVAAANSPVTAPPTTAAAISLPETIYKNFIHQSLIIFISENCIPHSIKFLLIKFKEYFSL